MVRLKNKRILIPLLALAVALGALLFLPGVAGPYIFDDYSNLLVNSYVRITSLDLDSLRLASYSLAAGPLQRPIAMASFAINYYFAGSFYPPTPYKLTNIILHAINGVLIFWFMRLVLVRVAQIPYQKPRTQNSTGTQHASILLAGAIALLWEIHPIQLTSILYVVQRMTELAALFTLLALLCYMKGRAAILAGQKTKAWLVVIGLLIFGCLGIYSKETAILIPVFILILEYTLYLNEYPWTRWAGLSQVTRRWVLATLATIIAALGIYAIHLVLPIYAVRDFTLAERLMTEGRVLIFYISQILVPRLNEFAMFHDDLAISRSLGTPWTTAPSLLLVAGLLTSALLSRKKYPLFSLGILWFFGGHLLESTIYPLEIAHEHRNYLPSLGILMAVAAAVDSISERAQQKKWFWILPGFAAAFSVITCARAYQWSSPENFFYYEAIHHPQSAAAQMGYGMLLMQQGQYSDGLRAYRRATRLNPDEPGLLINLYWSAALHGQTLTPADEKQVVHLLQAQPMTATTSWALSNVSSCILDDCRSLQPLMEIWLKTLLDKPASRFSDRSYNYYMLGRTLLGEGEINEAIDAYRKSYELDPQYLNPLIDLADMYIHLGRLDYARVIISEIKRANKRVIHPKTQQVERLESLMHEATLTARQAK